MEQEFAEDSSSDDEDITYMDVAEPSRPKQKNAGSGIERLEIYFGGKEYASTHNTQFVMRKQKSIKRFKKNGLIDTAIHVILTQMSSKEGFNRFGEREVSAMIKQLK